MLQLFFHGKRVKKPVKSKKLYKEACENEYTDFCKSYNILQNTN